MKTIKHILAFFIGGISLLNAQSTDESMLWEVSGNGLKSSSYLFGTMHMMCEKDFEINEKTLKAIDATSKLVLEVNLSDPEEMKSLQKLSMGEKPLSADLNKEEKEKLNQILDTHLGMKLEQVDSYSLMTLQSIFTMQSFGCANMKFFEFEFINIAKESKKEIVGFETATDQIEFLNESANIKDFIKQMEDVKPETLKNITSKMINLYKEEKLSELYKLVTDKTQMSKKMRKNLLEKRNINWVKIIPEMIQKESHFIAVGAAHLKGKKGVIKLLQKLGYKVTPVVK